MHRLNIRSHADFFRPMYNYGTHQCGNPFGFCVTQNLNHIPGQIIPMKDSGTNSVLDIVVHIGDSVCHADNIALLCICHTIGMAENAVADFFC